MKFEFKRVAHIISLLIFVLSFLFITGCSNDDKEKAAEEKPIIGVTIIPEKTFAEAVCGDLAEVVVMVPPGSSPENYEPAPKEIEKLNNASIYFSIGVPTEYANILPKIRNAKVVHLQDEAAAVYPERTFKSGERDPHVWLSPKRAKIMVKAIAREMCGIDEANKDIYNKNAAAYIKQLDELDKKISEILAGVRNKKMIAYHPAFGYFADDYGLEMYALQEEGKEATPQHLKEMTDLAEKENIKVIFYQEEIDGRQSAAFAEEIGGKAVCLSPLAANYVDNLTEMAQTLAEVMK